MLRGTPITILSDGLRIAEENLAGIGVSHKSTCWGVWVPNRTLEDQRDGRFAFRHFLISPFEPSSWPVLFRIEICIDGRDPDALAAALEPLAAADVSILSIDVTPAGHRHSVATIIVEAVTVKARGGILQEFKDLSDDERTIGNDRTWDRIHKTLAPAMLKKTAEIVNAIEVSDDDKKFLRTIFLDPNRQPTTGEGSRFDRGVLYDYNSLPDDIKELGKQQRTPAVRCTWMQNHAFFWLYRKNADKDIELNYDAPLRLMKVKDRGFRFFSTGVSAFPLPFKAIGLINHVERFIRVVLSPDEGRNRTVQVSIPFHAKYDQYTGSKGFQHQLYARLARVGSLNVRHVSMFTSHRTLNEEIGRLSLLVANVKELSEFGSLDDLTRDIQKMTDKAAEFISGQCDMVCSDVAVQRFSAPIVFVSTKVDWLHDFDGGGLKDAIRKIAMMFGFNVIFGDLDRAEVDPLVPEVIGKDAITDIVPEIIRRSAAFLQIIPAGALLERSKKGFGSLHWLMFEFGVARAVQLPRAILVEGDASDIPEWKGKLRVGSDYQLYAFNSKNGSSGLHKAIRGALRQMAK